MNTKMTTLMLGVAAMLASCSSDDALQVEQNDGLKAMTITATLPGDGPATRATTLTDDETAKKCYLYITDEQEYSEIINMGDPSDNKFTKNIYLLEGRNYKLYFYADNDNTREAAPTDFKNIAYTKGSIAFSGKNEEVKWSSTDVTVELKHIVARVTAKTTTALTVSETYPLHIKYKTYTAYNAVTGAVVGTLSDDTYTNTTTGDIASPDATNGTQIGFFYALVGASDQNQTLTMQYDGVKQNPEKTLSEVPMKINQHTILRGDFANWGLVNGNIIASILTDWEQEETKDF